MCKSFIIILVYDYDIELVYIYVKISIRVLSFYNLQPFGDSSRSYQRTYLVYAGAKISKIG